MAKSDGNKIKLTFDKYLNIENGQPVNPFTEGYELMPISTITASSTYSSDYSAENMIDDDTDTYWWGTGNDSDKITFSLASSQILTKISLYLNICRPTKLQLSGSTDNIAFTAIGDPINITTTLQAWYNFTFDSNTTKYPYYRLTVLDQSESDKVCIHEIRVYKTITLTTELDADVTFETYDYVPNGNVINKTITISSLSLVSTIDGLNIDITAGTNTNTELTNNLIRLNEYLVPDDEG